MTDAARRLRESPQNNPASAPGRDVGDAVAPILEAIDRSRWILELKPNWDEEGAIPYAEATWQRAGSFLLAAATRFLAQHWRSLPAPKLLPGPDGTIDVEWHVGQRHLFLNIPAEDCPISFYGDDEGKNTIKGTLELDQPAQFLLAWLAL